MMWSYVLNGFMVLLMLITYCFCLTNLEEAFDSPTGYPFIAVFTNTTGSRSGMFLSPRVSTIQQRHRSR